MKITFVTSNAGKAEEVSRYLGLHIEHVGLNIQEIQSLDLEEIVKDKAEKAYEKLKKPLLVEDVSLVFHSFGNLPGPLIKWFEKELGYDGLCDMVKGENRSCTATVCYGFHDGENIQIFSGVMEGEVADSPRGNNSFGWGPIFVPKGMEKTYSELTKEEQNEISFRRKALEKLKESLNL